MEQHRLVLSIGDWEVLQVLMEDGGFSVRLIDDVLSYPDADSCLTYIADEYLTPEMIDVEKPDRLIIEVREGDQRLFSESHSVFHDDLADYCATHSDDQCAKRTALMIRMATIKAKNSLKTALERLR